MPVFQYASTALQLPALVFS